MEYTTSLNLKKPGYTDPADIKDINDNMDILDQKVQEAFQSASNGKTTIASAITGMGQSASGSDTFATLAEKIEDISTDADVAISQVLSGKTFYQGGAKKTGTMSNRGSTIITPSTNNIAIAQGYHNGNGYVQGDANLISENIKSGTSIFGVNGSYSGGHIKSIQTIHADASYSPDVDTEDFTINPVVVANSIIKERPIGRSGSDGRASTKIEFLSSTSIRRHKDYDRFAPEIIQVIEFYPAAINSLQSGFTSLYEESAYTPVTVNITPVDPSKSLVYVNGWKSTGTNYSYVFGVAAGSINENGLLELWSDYEGHLYTSWFVVELNI